MTDHHDDPMLGLGFALTLAFAGYFALGAVIALFLGLPLVSIYSAILAGALGLLAINYLRNS